jgi:hypothetical protein
MNDDILQQEQEELYSVLSSTGFIDKSVFRTEIEKYTKRVLKQSPFDELLINLGECLLEVGGDPQILCSSSYLCNTPTMTFLETIAPNRIKFVVVPEENDNSV